MIYLIAFYILIAFYVLTDNLIKGNDLFIALVDSITWPITVIVRVLITINDYMRTLK